MIRELGRRWNTFWFEPAPTSTMALFRIAYGALLLLWAISLAPDARSFYSTRGILPVEAPRDYRYGVFDLVHSDLAVFVVVGLLIVAAACVLVGYRSRLAAVVSIILVLSLRDRNPWVLTGGETVLTVLGFFLVFMPSGEALSLDRWRKVGREGFWEAPLRAPWALRLAQLQISAVYLFTMWAKANGEQWLNGTAVGNIMHAGDFVRFAAPGWIRDSLLVSNALTWGTMAIELSLALLIWNRRWRPYVIIAGIALHLFIDVTMQLGFFTAAMFAGYVTFVPEDTASRWIERFRDRVERGRKAAVPAKAATSRQRRSRVPVGADR